MRWTLLVQELRQWDQAPGAGASRRQVPPLAPPGAVGHGRESGVRRQPRDWCIACFKAGLAAQGRGEVLDAARSRRHRRGVRTHCCLVRAPGCGRGSLTAGTE